MVNCCCRGKQLTYSKWVHHSSPRHPAAANEQQHPTLTHNLGPCLTRALPHPARCCSCCSLMSLSAVFAPAPQHMPPQPLPQLPASTPRSARLLQAASCKHILASTPLASSCKPASPAGRLSPQPHTSTTVLKLWLSWGRPGAPSASLSAASRSWPGPLPAAP